MISWKECLAMFPTLAYIKPCWKKVGFNEKQHLIDLPKKLQLPAISIGSYWMGISNHLLSSDQNIEFRIVGTTFVNHF